MLSHPSELIDLAHYSAQAQTRFAGAGDAYEHFAAEGQRRGLNPSAFFFTRWYAWQNDTRGQCVLAHFADNASHRIIDTAPFVDMTALLGKFPEAQTPCNLYLMLLRDQVPGFSPQAENHLAALRVARKSFQDNIEMKVLRPSGRKRRNLVWIQCGWAFRLASWFRAGATRDWDLLLNWYDLRCLDLRFGDIVLRQSGTKFTGICKVLREHPEILLRYDSVLFLDDDLILRHDEIDTIFSLAKSHELDLFQPSLSADSHGTWPDLFHREHSVVSPTTAAEIMMFGFTQRALAWCEPLFAQSVSGFGLDVACARRIRARNWKCGVIDAVQVRHPDKIDQTSGSYYQSLRSAGINPKLELFETLEADDIFPSIMRCANGDPVRSPTTDEDYPMPDSHAGEADLPRPQVGVPAG